MWEPVIGLEVHVQLATQSKIFSGASTVFGASPNTQACAIDLGLPGVLPVLNEQAVRMAVMFGLATHAEIAPCSVFARKNYFYPDLPKGYQISQYEQPIVGRGHIDINLNGQSKRIRITRAHLEEDAGKSIHDLYSNHTAIDLNRAGTALLEIVSEPDLRSAQEAVAYLKALHAIITYLGISDGNMAEGSMRCDANVSVRPKGQAEFGTRAEIKNVNSFRFVEKAIEYEIERQIDLLEQGGTVIQETRLFDSAKNETRSMRGKEEANDYRYFPDPDLLPVAIDPALLAEIRKSLPELPEQKLKRFTEDFQLSEYDANILVSDRQLADYFEQTLQTAQGHHKQCANWIISELLGRLNKEGWEFSQNPIPPEHLGLLILRITDGTLSGKIAKTVFDTMWQTKAAPDRIIEQQGLKQVTDSTEIEQFIDQVIQSSPKQVEQFINSPPEKQKKLTGYFVGQVMKLSQGKANPQQVNEVLLKKLAALS